MSCQEASQPVTKPSVLRSLGPSLSGHKQRTHHPASILWSRVFHKSEIFGSGGGGDGDGREGRRRGGGGGGGLKSLCLCAHRVILPKWGKGCSCWRRCILGSASHPRGPQLPLDDRGAPLVHHLAGSTSCLLTSRLPQKLSSTSGPHTAALICHDSQKLSRDV